MSTSLNDEIPASQQVRSSLGFLADLELYLNEKPFHLIISKDRDADSAITNIITDSYDNVPVTDVRGYENTFHLDVHGFQLMKHNTVMRDEDFDVDYKMRGFYYPEMEEFIRQSLGAQSVRVIQSTVRERPTDFETSNEKRLRLGKGCHDKPLTALHIGKTISISLCL